MTVGSKGINGGGESIRGASTVKRAGGGQAQGMQALRGASGRGNRWQEAEIRPLDSPAACTPTPYPLMLLAPLQGGRATILNDHPDLDSIHGKFSMCKI